MQVFWYRNQFAGVVRPTCLLVSPQFNMPFAINIIVFFLVGRTPNLANGQFCCLTCMPHWEVKWTEKCWSLSVPWFASFILFLCSFCFWQNLATGTVIIFFNWPSVFHEVSSFFTLRLKNILVKLFLLRQWITKWSCFSFIFP